MRLLVTGGGGFLGQALCRGLVERGHDVTSFNRGHYAALEAIGVRQVAGDLADRKAAVAVCAGMDAVFPMPPGGAWGSYTTTQCHVMGTGNCSRVPGEWVTRNGTPPRPRDHVQATVEKGSADTCPGEESRRPTQHQASTRRSLAANDETCDDRVGPG